MYKGMTDRGDQGKKTKFSDLHPTSWREVPVARSAETGELSGCRVLPWTSRDIQYGYWGKFISYHIISWF